MYNDKHEDYKLIYSPRTSLYNQKITEEKLYNELSKSFDPYTVKVLKRHFKEHFGVLDRNLFIGILKEHLLTWYPELPNREEILIKLLIRLFSEIDIDSDHYLTWDEFSNYIIHVTNSKKVEYSVYNLQQYLLSKENFELFENKNKGYLANKNDIDYFSNNVYYCFYVNKLKAIGLCYEGNNKIFFFDTLTLKRNGYTIDLLLSLKEIDKYEINELEEKTEEKLREQEEKIEKLMNKRGEANNAKNEILRKSVQNKNEKSPKNIINKKKEFFKFSKNIKRVMHIINTCFADEYDLLFISTTNNKISSWKFDFKYNCFNNVNLITSNELDFTFNMDEMKIPIFSTELPQYTMVFDYSTNNLYSGQKDGKILKWEMTSLRPVDILDIEKDKQNISKNKISLPPINSKFVKITENNTTLNNSDEKNNELNKKIKLTQERKRDSVSCLILLQGLRLLCSAYLNGQMVLWDTTTKKPKKRYNDQQTGIYNVIFDIKRDYLYTCGFEHDIFVYDPYIDSNAVYKLKGHNGSINSISLNSNINELVSIDILGTVKVWDTNKLICFQTININERILLDQNNVRKEEELFELFSSNKKKNLSSNIYIQALPIINKLLIYGEKFVIYEKGDISNPQLTDNCMILGCCYNKMLNNIITFSSRTVRFWNIFTGKLEKIYNDLVVISEISAYAIDEEFKIFFLGDNNGKIKSFYLSSGELIKEYYSHKEEISYIFPSKKYNYLISCSKDLCIKIQKLNSRHNQILNEIYPCKESGETFQEKNLLKNLSLDEEKGLLLLSLTNGWIIDYDIEHFKFLLNLNPNYNDSIRTYRVSNVLDIKEFDIIFVAIENGDKYFILKESNKYYEQYNVSKFGTFMEDNNNQNNDNNKNIVICSFYCYEENKLFTGDHLGFISCYDLTPIKNIFSDNNNNKNDVCNYLNNNIKINLIYKKQTHKESITFIDIPFGVKPKIIFSVSTDRIVHLIDYYTGDYIDSLKIISIKYDPIPIAIKYFKQNPFVPKVDNINKDFTKKLSNTEIVKKEKEEEKEINNYIKKYYENNLEKDDKPPNNVVYRYFFEQNRKPKKPTLAYEGKDNNDNIDHISFAYDLIHYEVKNKFNLNVYGQKLLPYRSTSWNYNIDVNNMINDGYIDLQKIRDQIKSIEKEIKETEKYFDKISINNKNYLPEYIKNLNQNERDQINEIIYNKINTFNLAVTRKNVMKKEIHIILLKSAKKRNVNTEVNNTESSIMSKINNNQESTLNSPRLKKRDNKNLPNIKNINIKIINNNKDAKATVKPISNRSRNKKINKITLRKKEESTILNTNFTNTKISKGNAIKALNLSKDNTDQRFIGYKNEFDEKYNEFKKPFEFLLKRNHKNYSKLFNKLSFTNNN